MVGLRQTEATQDLSSSWRAAERKKSLITGSIQLHSDVGRWKLSVLLLTQPWEVLLFLLLCAVSIDGVHDQR